MGNTILSHVLFSCNKVNLDLNNFFSESGNSHKINSLNNSELVAKHLIEYPDEHANCVLQMESDGWFYILQHKFSYHKWFNEVPTISDWNKFFKHIIEIDQNQIWQNFYSDIKDETWPECETFEKINSLPIHIVCEIKQLYHPPVVEINTDDQLLEFLTTNYFDCISNVNKFAFDAPVYQLSDYFDYKIQPLVNLSKMLNWQWNDQLSNQFYNQMLKANATHMAWLDIIKQYHDSIVSGIVCPVNLDLWERALLIAKVCQTLTRDPRTLKWQNSGCILEHDSATLIKLLQG